MTRHDDSVTLRQMRDHAREAIRLCEGRAIDELLTDRMFALSLERLLHILGEAAGRVSQGTRDRYAEIPWRDMIAVRNRLSTHTKRPISLCCGILCRMTFRRC